MAEDALPAIDTEIEDSELFDVSIDADILEEDALEAEEGPNPYGISWAFNFGTGDIYTDANGALAKVTEKDTLKQWIGHTLSIARGETSIFSNDIGTDIPRLYGSSTSSSDIINRIKLEVRLALEVHDKIADIGDIAIFPVGDALYIYVEYVTDDHENVSELIGL